jgi:hypothetical protein
MDTIVETADIVVHDRRKEILTCLQDMSRPKHPEKSCTKLSNMHYLMMHYIYQTIKGIMLKCLDTKEAKLAITKVHEGICALRY